MRKFLPFLLAPMLVACGGEGSKPTNDITELRVACEKESGFSGDAMVVTETGTVFVWRADGEMVAECQGHNRHVHLVSIF
jgi:hypothetical protein